MFTTKETRQNWMGNNNLASIGGMAVNFFLDDSGCWRVEGKPIGSVYETAVIKYLGILHPVFCCAREASEFDYIHTLLGIRGWADAGWDPFDNTVRTIHKLREVCRAQTDYYTQANLELWIYGHIIEASEPYEIIMNLLTVIDGGRFRFSCFPPERRGNREYPIYPWKKQDNIRQKAESLGIVGLDELYDGFYDGRLRNAIFHSDYTIHGGEIRIMSPFRSYSREEINILSNYALAYIDCIERLVKGHLGFYTESTVIPAPPGFSANPYEMVRVIVREGDGAIGLMTELTNEQVAAGHIRAKLIRHYPDETELVENHAHTLPKRPKNELRD